MEFGTPNPESNAEFERRAIDQILREICRKYKEERNPVFSAEEIETTLRGINAEYLRFRLRDILKGYGLLEFNEDGSLSLTDVGKEECDKRKPS